MHTFFLLKSLVCLAISWLATGHDDLEESEMFIPNTCDRNPKLEARTTLRILTPPMETTDPNDTPGALKQVGFDIP